MEPYRLELCFCWLVQQLKNHTNVMKKGCKGCQTFQKCSQHGAKQNNLLVLGARNWETWFTCAGASRLGFHVSRKLPRCSGKTCPALRLSASTDFSTLWPKQNRNSLRERSFSNFATIQRLLFLHFLQTRIRLQMGVVLVPNVFAEGVFRIFRSPDSTLNDFPDFQKIQKSPKSMFGDSKIH